jgi:putative Mg2+ transporter-C (MgtC) family protein
MIAETEIFLRILLAGAFGAVVGYERERRGQPAGLRTHAILSIGAALAMTLSINLAYPDNDPARLAAQVVSGIGFLGAGAIFRYGTSIKGLTTATSLWTTAMVGLATGAGLYLASAGTTVLLLIVLVWLEALEKRFIHQTVNLTVVVTANVRRGLLKDLKKVLNDPPRTITSTNFSKDVEQDLETVTLVVKTNTSDPTDDIMEELSDIKSVKRIEIS